MPNGKKKIYDPKFLGGTFRTTLLFVLFIELLSFFTHWMKIVVDFTSIIYLLLVGVVFIVSLKNLKYGVLIAMGELFIGSQGHYFDLELGGFLLSIRIGIFVAVMAAWLYRLFAKKLFTETFSLLKNNKTLVALAVISLWGLVFAAIRGVSPKDIFLDFNAWLYFLYFFPFLSVIESRKDLNHVWQIFTASIVAISVKSLFFLYIFSHQIPRMMKYLYLWGRDTRWGEFTLIQDGFFRIFSQSQIFVIIGAFILLGYLIFKGRLDYKEKENRYLSLILLFSTATTVLSLSRSFWLAFVVTTVALLGFALFVYRFNLRDIFASFVRIALLGLISIIFIVGIINFPFPAVGNVGSGSAISERLALSGAAISSRWSQLPTLTDEILKYPMLGSGWGTSVTYQSQDPRILTVNNPEGWYTTSAFEWGYLDILLKIGVVGLFIYLAVLFNLYKQLWVFGKKNKDRFSNALLTGLSLGLFSLIIVHGFTPYLNHPLGIGFLLIIFITLKVLYKHQPKLDPTKA
jgi:hypothetical protein